MRPTSSAELRSVVLRWSPVAAALRVRPVLADGVFTVDSFDGLLMGRRLSVTNGKTLAPVIGLLELIHKRDGVIFHRDAALLLLIGDELVRAQSKLAGTLARLEIGRRSEIGPVDR